MWLFHTFVLEGRSYDSTSDNNDWLTFLDSFRLFWTTNASRDLSLSHLRNNNPSFRNWWKEFRTSRWKSIFHFSFPKFHFHKKFSSRRKYLGRNFLTSSAEKQSNPGTTSPAHQPKYENINASPLSFEISICFTPLKITKIYDILSTWR